MASVKILNSTKDIKVKAGSIALVQVTGFLSTLAFLFFLPNKEMVFVVGIVALSGMISGTTASNNTAKLYTTIGDDSSPKYVFKLTLILFLCEQILAVLIVTVLCVVEEVWSQGLGAIELVLLASSSCSSALVAFVKYDSGMFVYFNIVRVLSVLARLLLVFCVVWNGVSDWIPVILITSYAVPTVFGFALAFSFASRDKSREEGGG